MRRVTPFCGATVASAASLRTAGIVTLTSARSISWNPAKWGSGAIAGRESHQNIEEELPEVFAQQPLEVDDFIRPERSVFEKLEDFWDWIVSFMQPVEKQMDIMRSLRHDGLFGFDFGTWGHVFFFYGVVMRLFTLIPSLYSHRNALRMGHIGPQISEITNSQSRAKNDRTLSSAEKRVIKDGYNRMKYALMKKHGCAQWKSFLTAITTPITMSAFFSIRRLAVYETDLEMAPFLWVKDLTMPDPTYGLPLICAGMFLMNFELNQMMQRGGRSSSGIYIRWAVRLGSLVGVYAFASQPSAMFAYWIGLSTAGLLQPLLLRWQPFRDFFQFPDPPQAAKSQIITEVRGPSIMERLFASKEEQSRREKERQMLRDEQKKKKFDKVDDYDEVVFEDNDDLIRSKRKG
ncbi:preprotein translocase subunit YidC [Trypanosoma theileri]|uniref:Preprotein translocase subunit YidC n=1 Tax=Trypanosoma theileri TaxID=67003 RepID=A0A1X0NWK5_9TRYP|nr:preprotein translocase subunit YidC [Trypanosoma theileri]ORC88490.1 preprotein translocase subunit YidC [Trypanosoma theileri]